MAIRPWPSCIGAQVSNPPAAKVGQRVSRKDSDELGAIVEVDGEIKVKWDSGRTSYYRRSVQANVQLIEK